MRVAVVCPIPFGAGGSYGGGTRYPEELARAMQALAECDLIAFGPKSGEFVDSFGLRHVCIRDRSRVERNHDPLSSKIAAMTKGYDVVHFHTVNKMAVVGALLCRARGQSAVLTPLGGAGLTGIGRLRLYRLFVGFPVISQATITAMPWIGGRPHSVVYGGGDATAFRCLKSSPGQVHRSRVVYVGRIAPHKGVDVLIKAMPAGAELVVCGEISDSEYASHLRSLAEGKQVEFVATATDEEVSELYSSAVAAVLPSVFVDFRGGQHRDPELLGLVLLEAMWHGAPVVATRMGATSEIVGEGVDGFLVPSGDHRAMGEALVRLLEDSSLVSTTGSAARRSVEARFTWAAVADRVYRFYGEVAGGADRERSRKREPWRSSEKG